MGRRPTTALLTSAEQLVREALALAAELGEPVAPTGFELADDPGSCGPGSCAPSPPSARSTASISWKPPEPSGWPTLVSETADAKQMLAFRLGWAVKIRAL